MIYWRFSLCVAHAFLAVAPVVNVRFPSETKPPLHLQEFLHGLVEKPRWISRGSWGVGFCFRLPSVLTLNATPIGQWLGVMSTRAVATPQYLRQLYRSRLTDANHRLLAGTTYKIRGKLQHDRNPTAGHANMEAVICGRDSRLPVGCLPPLSIVTESLIFTVQNKEHPL